jgi:purine-binding chemotaxis protein CheW
MHVELGSPPVAEIGRRASIQSALEYLTFKLGAVEYGIDILKVQEIRGYEAPTGLPNAPECVKGVLNLRGVIVPVFDLRVKFNCETAAFDALTVTVILSLSDRVIGVVVDAVRDVVELSPSQIKPAPSFSVAPYAECVTGIASTQQDGAERMLVLLDIEQIIAGATFVSDITAVRQ